MTKLSEKGVSYIGGFFMLIAFAIGGMILGSLIAAGIIMATSGVDPLALTQIMGKPEYFREMQIMQSISAFFSFFIPTIFTASRLSSRPLELTGFTGTISQKQILFTLFIIACGLALSSSLGYMSYQIPFPAEWKAYFSRLESDYMKMAANLIRLDNPFELFISLIVLAVIPAVCEETLFRGGLQNYLYRHTNKLWFSVIIVSLIFSVVHFSFYGFLSRFMLGIVLGLLYQYSGKLWLPIIAHFINNAMAVTVMYVQHANGKTITEIMSDRDGSYFGLLVIPVIVFLFVKFREASLVNKTTDGV